MEQPTPPRLRMMRTGDILDASFALYRRHFKLFAGLVAVLAVPYTIVVQYLMPLVGGDSSSPAATVDAFALPVLFLTVWGMIAGALATAVSATYLGQPVTIGSAYRSLTWKTVLWLDISCLLAGVVIFSTIWFFLAPAVFFFCRFAFIPQAVVLEDQGVFGSWNRSWFLVDGSWWRVFGVEFSAALLFGILLGVGAVIRDGLGGVVQLPPTAAALLGPAWDMASEVVVLPIPFAVLTLLYYDLRVRKEGFDLEVLAGTLHRQASP